MADIDIGKAFLGIGWSFPPEFQKHVDVLGVKMVAEEEDIAESLKILLSTSPGERVMQPSYGCGLRTKVFGIINQSSVTEIRDIIERAVLFFEPRVELEDIEVDTDDALEGKLKINLTYRVRKTNTRSNIVYPFYFLEGSQVRV
jgi:phage baseplate assembly protein W